MSRLTILVVAGLTVIAPGLRAGIADDPLDAAKTLYLSAAYEEALTALTNLPAGVDVDQADKFRALCQLALNRTEDAQQTLERLATRRPLLKLDDEESPKLVALYRDARSRVLPAVVKSLYASAKNSFEKGQLTTAAGQFNDLISLLSSKELAGQAEFSDLKMLADGFSKLATQQLSVERSPAATPARVTPPPPVDPLPVRLDPARIYTATDPDVTPPVTIEQTVPRWVPPPGSSFQNQEFSGTLEIVIDETGIVTSAALSQRLNVVYDQLLLSAVKRWRYQPAQRSGKPVKYRKLLNIVLRPAGPETERSQG